jgi:hypothetical protein
MFLELDDVTDRNEFRKRIKNIRFRRRKSGRTEKKETEKANCEGGEEEKRERKTNVSRRYRTQQGAAQRNFQKTERILQIKERKISLKLAFKIKNTVKIII